MERNAFGQDIDNYSARFASYESLFQDDSGEIIEPVGQTCDRLFCFQIEQTKDQGYSPSFFWLSVFEGAYYRFFMDDAYFVQWFRANAALLEEEISEEGNCPVLDLSQLYGLVGQKIVSIVVDRVDKNQLYILRLRVIFTEGHFLYLEFNGDKMLMEVV